MFDIGVLDADDCHVNRVLLTHGHLDHSALLPYYISQRSLRKLPPPDIYLHKELYDPMKEILSVYSKIEGFDYKFNLHAVEPGEKIDLNKTTFFKPLPTFHRVPSQGYTIFETTVKLKDEFKYLDKSEIIRRKTNEEDLFVTKEIPVVSFSGDTKIEYVLENDDVKNSKILFLECTYIDHDRDVNRAREWGHTHLDEIIQHAEEFQNEKIVLIHFSKRYTRRFIRETIARKIPESLKDKIHIFG